MWKCENFHLYAFTKCHHKAVIPLNLNSTSLFGNSSAEERIKVLIMVHALGGFYVYISKRNSQGICFFSTWVSSVSQKAYPSPLTARGCAVHLGSEE